jgi:SNF2 family DNA or RNA helicase
MTGTPIENHLGELWSQFEFLNPGMLGNESVFKRLSSPGNEEVKEPSTLATLASALRPFILRRTKEEVLKELPPKTEQLLYCDFDEEEKKRYDQLKDYYRVNLLNEVKDIGLGKSKIQILEALLRLRQASCHFGLIDPSQASQDSAKMRVLMDHLKEILSVGHKALIFSQFTSFLSLVRNRLDQDGLVYEYLDGKTTDRKERVKRFQEDPQCPLFLLSLKAGGVGLNLTKADYVFILDPWWNPAVEAQAIDRTHRIGQKNPVMVYRLITKETVEEKVLELQDKKKNLSKTILSSDKTLLKGLTIEDLRVLLS